jgi:WD40 repeat protein
MMHICDHRYRCLFTLEGPVQLVCKLNHCPDPLCPGHTTTKSPDTEPRIALSGWIISWDVFCWIGHRRFARHWSIPQIRGELLDSYAIALSENSVANYVRRYQTMLAARQQDIDTLRDHYRGLEQIILSIDGLQPEKGHETLYVVRELLGKRVWFAEALISASADEVQRLIALAKRWAVIPNVGEHVDGLRFSADGAKIVANASWQIGIWDVASGRSESFRLVPRGTLTFAPDGRVAAFGFFGALAIWDNASFGPRLALEKGIIHWSDVGVIDTGAAAFSPDGHTLAGNGGKTALHFCDAVTKRDRLAMPEAHSGGVDSILVSSNGKSVITSDRDATVRLWDIESKRQRRVLPLRGWPRSIALSSDERWLLAISQRNEGVYVWDLQNEKAAAIISTDVSSGYTVAACFSKPDNRVQVYWSDGRLRGLNLETGRSTSGKDANDQYATASNSRTDLHARWDQDRHRHGGYVDPGVGHAARSPELRANETGRISRRASDNSISIAKIVHNVTGHSHFHHRTSMFHAPSDHRPCPSREHGCRFDTGPGTTTALGESVVTGTAAFLCRPPITCLVSRRRLRHVVCFRRPASSQAQFARGERLDVFCSRLNRSVRPEHYS